MPKRRPLERKSAKATAANNRPNILQQAVFLYHDERVDEAQGAKDNGDSLYGTPVHRPVSFPSQNTPITTQKLADLYYMVN